jgi:hypothetical protein
VVVEHNACHYRRNNEKHAPQGNNNSQKSTLKPLPASLIIQIDVNQFFGSQGNVPPILPIDPGLSRLDHHVASPGFCRYEVEE